MKNDVSISRRVFMARLAALGSLALAFPASLLAELRTANADGLQPEWTYLHPWQTLAAVQDILFPAGKDIPGAIDIGALTYLHNAIENPATDGEDREFIFKGIGWLDDLTRERHQKNFIQLPQSEQEQIIQTTVHSRAGRNWVSLLLTYILEALLADPVYGGNRDGIGWKWLEHQPGYPHPPPDKTWDRLQQRRYKA